MNKGEAMQVFDGLMLGDGGLERTKGGARYHMKLSKQLVPKAEESEYNKLASFRDHLKWEQWVAVNAFSALGIEVSAGYPAILNGRIGGKPYQSAKLMTYQSPLLTDLYDKWYTGGEWIQSGRTNYVRGAIKILPERIMKLSELPVLSLVHWFLGDGTSMEPTLSHHRKVSLAPCCFSEKEVHHLASLLNNVGVATTKLSKHKDVVKGSGLVIILSITGNNTNRFMDLVEPHILEIFGDSESPSYKDMIKRKSNPSPNPTFDTLRARLKGG